MDEFREVLERLASMSHLLEPKAGSNLALLNADLYGGHAVESRKQTRELSGQSMGPHLVVFYSRDNELALQCDMSRHFLKVRGLVAEHGSGLG